MFRPNPRAKAELQRDPAYDALRRRAARDVVTQARAISPDATGHYDRGLDVREDGDTIAASSTDIAAHMIEFGSVNNPAYAPLRRGVRAAGLDLRD